MFKSIINRLKPQPAEIKICLGELDLIERQFDLLKGHPLWENVRKLLQDTDNILATINNLQCTPRDTVLLLLSKETGYLLGSGQYHVYRGLLSMIGNRVLELYTFCLAEMLKSGFFSEQEAKTDREWVQKEINEMG